MTNKSRSLAKLSRINTNNIGTYTPHFYLTNTFWLIGYKNLIQRYYTRTSIYTVLNHYALKTTSKFAAYNYEVFSVRYVITYSAHYIC